MSVIKEIIEDIQKAYLADERPWIVGFSGGKDSTALLQLVYIAVSNLATDQRHKQIYVLCSDTGVEPPNIIKYIDETIDKINEGATKDVLPIQAFKLTPSVEDRFFVKIIGRGYPAPNRSFRWCTDRLKVRPSNTFIKNQIDAHGSVVVLLGVRSAESSTRSGSITKHRIEGSNFSKHSTLPNALVYSPISLLTTHQVWAFLVGVPCPWGANNRDLASLYRQAEGGKECPVVFDGSSPVCGGSRFGCWTCTVIERDKSMEGFIESGEEWMLPLLEFRNWLAVARNNLSMRDTHRRNGQLSPGPFTLAARNEILQRLIETEIEVGVPILIEEEKALIYDLWVADGYEGETIFQIEQHIKSGKVEAARRREKVKSWATLENLRILQAGTDSLS